MDFLEFVQEKVVGINLDSRRFLLCCIFLVLGRNGGGTHVYILNYGAAASRYKITKTGICYSAYPPKPKLLPESHLHRTDALQ